ncbi:hypothetical protein NQ315_014235 [Exocentrus adspersus]|uniref:Ataxin-10 n=1 Tax=Exocentrus adspersus TaxID=1586481 RepID=A0AAV8VCN6_9CUCU|nr:hypothetical protein NQ315_014235 [Exocentrus adspersus]
MSIEAREPITASEGALNYLDKLLKLQVDKLQNDNMQDLQVTTEILRSLRNCTSDLLTQQYIIADTNILDTTGAIFSIVITIDENNLCLKILLQFLINLMSSNKAVGEKIFVMYYERAKKCLQRKVHVYESAALIYNISLIKPIPDTELMNTVLDLYCEGFENEFLIFFLENSMLDSNFWNTYIHFKTEYKVIILKTLRNMELQRRTYSIPSVALEILIEQFLKFCDNIFHILENDECSIKAYEVLLLLEVLSSLSSDENYLKEFQSNKNVLINAGALLINIHMLGKQNNNCFTPIQKFKINHGLKEHPAFGFKADLIRLIGNICWKHKTMQDLVNPYHYYTPSIRFAKLNDREMGKPHLSATRYKYNDILL